VLDNMVPAGKQYAKLISRRKTEVVDRFRDGGAWWQCIRSNGIPVDPDKKLTMQLEEHDLIKNDFSKAVTIPARILQSFQQSIKKGLIKNVTLVTQFTLDNSNWQSLLEADGLLGFVTDVMTGALCISALDLLPSGRAARLTASAVKVSYKAAAKVMAKQTKKKLVELAKGSLKDSAKTEAEQIRSNLKKQALGEAMADPQNSKDGGGGISAAAGVIDAVSSVTDMLEFCLVDAIDQGHTDYKVKYVIEPAPDLLFYQPTSECDDTGNARALCSVGSIIVSVLVQFLGVV